MPPNLPTDDILSCYLAAEMPLVGVAKRFDLTLDQLLDVLDHPDTQSRLARLKHANETRAHHIAADARPAAISALANIATTADPTESRRAATALLRELRPLSGATADPKGSRATTSTPPPLPPRKPSDNPASAQPTEGASPTPRAGEVSAQPTEGARPLLPPTEKPVEKVSAQRTDEGTPSSPPPPSPDLSTSRSVDLPTCRVPASPTPPKAPKEIQSRADLFI